MRGALDPTEVLEDTLEAYFASAAGGGGPVYISLLVALGVAAAALPLVRVDVTARAPGMLRPSIERHRVTAGAAGVVARVGARLGQAVRAGDTLVVLRADALAAGVLATDSALAELRARRDDLRSLVALAGALARVGEGAAGDALSRVGDGTSAGTPTEAGHREGGGAMVGARPRLARYRAEWGRALREWRTEVREVAPARAAAARADALAVRGLLAPAEHEQALLRAARATSAPALAVARFRTTWEAELSDVEGRLRAEAVERGRLRAQAELAVVRAPVAGTLETLSPLSPGSWLGSGEEVAVISPAAPLVAEVFVESREIARVHPGQPVRLLVDAFDQHEWGTLPATVLDVGDDFALVDGRPRFRVRCAPGKAELERAPRRGRTGRPGLLRARPGKGMGVTAIFVLGRRSLFHLLWDRASATMAWEAARTDGGGGADGQTGAAPAARPGPR